MAKKILTPIDLSAVPSGTAPLVVTSPTAVTNLNADLLDGQHGSYYQSASNINAGTLAVARGGTGIGSYTANNYIRALSATVLEQRTPAQVLGDIGAAGVSANNAFTGSNTFAGVSNFNNATAVNSTLTSYWYAQATHGTPRANLGNPTVTEMALFDSQFSNKTWFYNPTKFLFEYTTDGTTWVTDPVSTANIKGMVSGNTVLPTITIPNACVKYRVTIVNDGSYVYLNALYLYLSTQANTTQVHLWKRRNDDGIWVQHTSSAATVSTYPGHAYMPFTTVPWSQNSTAGHFNDVRIEFTPNWVNGNPILLYKLELWGGYPNGKRVLYDWDHDKNATFPAGVTATGFTGPLTGNASTATALQTARTIAISGPITGTATSFNGSANITIPVTSLNLADAAVTGTLGAARMPALTGDVTTTVGTVGTTIAAGVVTLAKMANMATASFLGRSTAGTGAPEVLSAATARTVMGATTAGGNFFTLANPGAITFPRINADNTVSALDAAAFRTAIGVTAGGGTVTSVNLGASTGLTPSGGPITGSGTLTYTLSANLQSWSGIAPATKADDSGVVHIAGTETITGTKTLSQPIRLAIGGVGTQQVMTHWGWNNGVARWKWAMEGNAGLSLYSYDTAEGNPTQSLFISTTQTGGANALTASLPFKATSLAAGTNAQIGAFPFDIDSSVGRVLIRNNGGTNSLDSVNHANNAYIQFNFHASSFVFNGGAMSISNGGLVTGGGITASTGDIIAGSGDLRSNRAGNPTHGVVWLGNTSSRYLFYDGTNYTMPGAQLYVNGGLVYHSGNYNPANAANFTTGTLLSGVMPTGMGATGTTITDWNNATSNGIYMASAAANAPSSAWFIGRVTVHNSGWITQEVWDFTGNAATNVWRRGLFNGTWSGWTQSQYIAGVLLSTDGSNTLVTQGTPRSWNRPQILYSNGAGYVETPRIFVQSSDPGAAAADGDLWFW